MIMYQCFPSLAPGGRGVGSKSFIATYPSISYKSRLSWTKINNLSTECLMRKQLPFEEILVHQLGLNCFYFQTLNTV